MNELKIGDFMWHPCNLDIIKHKIISIRQFEGFNHYVLKAENNVGACGRIEVIVDEHKGKFRFVELLNEENIEYSSGLWDFVEGNYYSTENAAKLEFYQQQYYLTYSSMEKYLSLYNESKRNHDRVKLLVDELKTLLK